MWEWQDLKLQLSQEGRLGIKIVQDGRMYIAKNWTLSDKIFAICNDAFSVGLTCMIQHGHPTESRISSSVDYISFSLSRDDYWVFALDMDSCVGTGPRVDPQRTKFKKIYRHILRENNIKCPAEWRTPQNLLVDVNDLKDALRFIMPYVPTLGKMKGARTRRGAHNFFVDEEDLHSFLVSQWPMCPSPISSMSLLGSKVLLNNIAHRQGEIDLLARDESGNLFVIELKDMAKGKNGESPVQQLCRYMEHPDIVRRAREQNGNIFGILIAQEIAHDVCIEIASCPLPIVGYEATKTAQGVVLEKVGSSATAAV